MMKNYLIIGLAAASLYGCGTRVKYTYEKSQMIQYGPIVMQERSEMVIEKRTTKSIEELVKEFQKPEPEKPKESKL